MISHQDKKGAAAEIQTLEPGKKSEDIIRDPYVLELLGLEQNASFYESELEQALIDHLQKFLLELERGFSFVARQKRFTFDGEHFYIYTREMMNEGDNLPIGIVLCAGKSESVVRYTLPEDNHQVLLPSISFTCRQRKNCARNCSVNILCWMMLCRMKQETSKARGK